MANLIEMPKLSDTMTVGTLVKWLKQEGDAVKTGDMLAEVETDKATMELECFFDGTLVKIFSPAGSQVAVGTPLCAVGQPGEKVDAPASAAPPPRLRAAAAPAPAAASAKAGTAPAPAVAAGSGAAPSAAAPLRAQGERIKISPLARKLARKLGKKGIDPAGIAGSGPGGRIVRADVLAGGKSRQLQTGRPAQPGQRPPFRRARRPEPADPGGKAPSASNMRAVVARRLLEAKTQIPHFYLDIEIDADPLMELRAQLNASLEADGVKLSVNDFILKASVEALRRVPAVNCSWKMAKARRSSW